MEVKDVSDQNKFLLHGRNPEGLRFLAARLVSLYLVNNNNNNKNHYHLTRGYASLILEQSFLPKECSVGGPQKKHSRDSP